MPTSGTLHLKPDLSSTIRAKRRGLDRDGGVGQVNRQGTERLGTFVDGSLLGQTIREV